MSNNWQQPQFPFHGPSIPPFVTQAQYYQNPNWDWSQYTEWQTNNNYHGGYSGPYIPGSGPYAAGYTTGWNPNGFDPRWTRQPGYRQITAANTLNVRTAQPLTSSLQSQRTGSSATATSSTTSATSKVGGGTTTLLSSNHQRSSPVCTVSSSIPPQPPKPTSVSANNSSRDPRIRSGAVPSSSSSRLDRREDPTRSSSNKESSRSGSSSSRPNSNGTMSTTDHPRSRDSHLASRDRRPSPTESELRAAALNSTRPRPNTNTILSTSVGQGHPGISTALANLISVRTAPHSERPKHVPCAIMNNSRFFIEGRYLPLEADMQLQKVVDAHWRAAKGIWHFGNTRHAQVSAILLNLNPPLLLCPIPGSAEAIEGPRRIDASEQELLTRRPVGSSMISTTTTNFQPLTASVQQGLRSTNIEILTLSPSPPPSERIPVPVPVAVPPRTIAPGTSIAPPLLMSSRAELFPRPPSLPAPRRPNPNLLPRLSTMLPPRPGLQLHLGLQLQPHPPQTPCELREILNPNDYRIPGFQILQHLIRPSHLMNTIPALFSKQDRIELPRHFDPHRSPQILLLRIGIAKDGVPALDDIKRVKLIRLKFNEHCLELPKTGSIHFTVDATPYLLNADRTAVLPYLELDILASVESRVIEKGDSIFMCLTIARRLNATEMLEELNTKARIPFDRTRKMVADKIKDDIENGISTSDTNLSPSLLICPIGKTKITIPCRGCWCEHYACFDGWNFLMTYEKKFDWTCPNCNVAFNFEDLRVDSYFDEVLKSIGDNDVNSCQVKINSDGSFVICAKEQSQGTRPVTIALIEDDDIVVIPSSDEEVQPPAQVHAPPSPVYEQKSTPFLPDSIQLGSFLPPTPGTWVSDEDDIGSCSPVSGSSTVFVPRTLPPRPTDPLWLSQDDSLSDIAIAGDPFVTGSEAVNTSDPLYMSQATYDLIEAALGPRISEFSTHPSLTIVPVPQPFLSNDTSSVASTPQPILPNSTSSVADLPAAITNTSQTCTSTQPQQEVQPPRIQGKGKSMPVPNKTLTPPADSSSESESTSTSVGEEESEVDESDSSHEEFNPNSEKSESESELSKLESSEEEVIKVKPASIQKRTASLRISSSDEDTMPSMPTLPASLLKKFRLQKVTVDLRRLKDREVEAATSSRKSSLASTSSKSKPNPKKTKRTWESSESESESTSESESESSSSSDSSSSSNHRSSKYRNRKKRKLNKPPLTMKQRNQQRLEELARERRNKRYKNRCGRDRRSKSPSVERGRSHRSEGSRRKSPIGDIEKWKKQLCELEDDLPHKMSKRPVLGKSRECKQFLRME